MKSIRIQLPVLTALLLGNATVSLAAKIPHETYSATESDIPAALTLEEPAQVEKAEKPVQEEGTPAVTRAPKKLGHKARKRAARQEASPLTKRVEALEAELKDLREKVTASPSPAPAEETAATEATEKTPAYDSVPSDQTDSIIKRLQLTEELVRKYGRAYDYRTHTTQSLQAILSDLKKVPSTGPLPAPKETDPKDPAQDESRNLQLRVRPAAATL